MNSQRELWEAVKSEYLKQIEEALKALDLPNKKEMLDDVAAHLQRKYRDLTLEEKCLEKFKKIITQMGPASDYVELLKTSGSESPAQPPLPPENGESRSSETNEPDKASAEENPTTKRVGVPVFVPVVPPYDDQTMLLKAKWLGLGIFVALGIAILIFVLKHQRNETEIIAPNAQTTPAVSPQAAAPVASATQTTGGGGTNNVLDLDLQTYIVSFTTASDVNAITARELLTMFNAKQPPNIKTHHYKTEVRENMLVGLICIDGKSDVDATAQILLSSNDLKLVSIEPATEETLKKLYAMSQPSLTAKLPVPSAPAAASTPTSAMPAAETTNTIVPPAPLTPQTENMANAIQKVHPPQSGQPIVFVAKPTVDGIVVGKPNCTANFVKSLLGAPKRIDSNGRMLRYTDDGIDFWFSLKGPLSEIHLNNGFEGRLDTGISFTSTQQDVFTAYGEPVETIRTADLHRRNNERVLYVKDDTSRIYYGKYGLIFWFKNDRISQIVVFEGRMKNAGASFNRGEMSQPLNGSGEDFLMPVQSWIENGRTVDKIDYKFFSDPEAIGHWTSVDFVKNINDFNPARKSWGGNLDFIGFVLTRNGTTSGPWRWTKGIIVHPGDKTASRYLIKDFNGTKYMFFEWKSGDYTIRHQTPSYYVLKKAG